MANGSGRPTRYYVAWLVVMCAASGPPAPANGQALTPRIVVQGGGGVLLPTVGSVAWVGGGVAIGERLDLLVAAERQHAPTTVEDVARTRGSRVTVIGGEVRVVPKLTRPVTPYAVLSLARGRSRLEMDDVFSDFVTNDAWLFLFGVGLRVGARRGLGAFIDLRYGIQGELDVILPRTPLRLGATWRF